MSGWIDPKMPTHYIAKANPEKLGMRDMEKIVALRSNARTSTISSC
jgi:hypothetical protein